MGLNAYGGDLALPYPGFGFFGFPLPLVTNPYAPLQSYTCATAPEGASFALAYDHGQVFMLYNGALDAYDEQTLLSGAANDYYNDLLQEYVISAPAFGAAGLTPWRSDHFVAVVGTAFAATVDGAHNIFYTDPLGKDIAVTGKAYSNGQGGGATGVAPKRLLDELVAAFRDRLRQGALAALCQLPQRTSHPRLCGELCDPEWRQGPGFTLPPMLIK